jgi:hypothetical protein
MSDYSAPFIKVPRIENIEGGLFTRREFLGIIRRFIGLQGQILKTAMPD